MTFPHSSLNPLLLLAAVTTLFGNTMSLHAETSIPINTEILLQRLHHPDPLTPLPEEPVQNGKLILPLSGNRELHLLPQGDGSWGQLVTVDDQQVYLVECDDGNSVYLTQSPIFADEPEKAWFIYVPCGELPLMQADVTERKLNGTSSTLQNSSPHQGVKPSLSSQKETTASPVEKPSTPTALEKAKEPKWHQALKLTYNDLSIGAPPISNNQPFYKRLPLEVYDIGLFAGKCAMMYYLGLYVIPCDFVYRLVTLKS